MGVLSVREVVRGMQRVGDGGTLQILSYIPT